MGMGLEGVTRERRKRGAAVMDSTHDAGKDDTGAEGGSGAAAAAPAASADAMAILRDIDVEITLEIGRKRMKIADVVKLGPGRTVELDKLAGEPLELLVNGRVIGRGEAIVVGDRYGIRITEILAPEGSGR